jgi:putative glutamine amidotransferase
MPTTPPDTRPLIGVPCRHDISHGYWKSPINAQNEAYLNALTTTGAIPFLIPLNLDTAALRRLYDLADGLLLTGGGDIDPSLYRQDTQVSLADFQPDRDALEVLLTRWAMADDKPTLGICRGIQMMAVASGGSLCQDLPTMMPQATAHNYVYNDLGTHEETDLIHEVTLAPDCKLAQAMGTEALWVNSLHHQAVQSVGEPLHVVGHASDGVVEAVEHPSHRFFCGIQWHPELLFKEHAAARRVFEAFVAVAGG